MPGARRRRPGVHPDRRTRHEVQRWCARAVRARRRGSGVRARRVAASTTPTTSWAWVCQAAWTATGLAPGRVRTQQPTSPPPSSSGAVPPRWSGGQAPWATSGRVVTPDGGQPKHGPQVQGKASTAGMVAAGGVDQQHLGGDGQGTNGLLEQGSLLEGEQGWQVGPAGGPAAGHPGQQATLVGDRRPGEPSVAGGTGSLGPLEADEAGTDPEQGCRGLPASRG
jgi:hypothetical protein